MKKLNKIAASIKKIRCKSTDDLNEKLTELGWTTLKWSTLLSPCKKYVFKPNGLCYKANTKFKELYLPTVKFRKNGESWLVQPLVSGSDKMVTYRDMENRIAEVIAERFTKEELVKKLLKNDGHEDFLNVDFHSGNVGYYNNKVVFHDW